MQSSIKTAALLLALGAGLAACGKKNEDQSHKAADQKAATEAPAQKEADAPTPEQKASDSMTDTDAYKAENLAYLETNKDKEGVHVTDSGVQYKILKSGDADGKSPTKEDIVKVNYEGRTIDGKVFDASERHGGPAQFQLGRVIPGWIEALQLMHVGDKWEITIPSELAYGERGAGGVIPPNSTLVFDVELLGVKDLAAAEAEAKAQMEAFKTQQADYLAENAKKDGFHVTDSGLQYKVITEGTGKSPTADSQVTVNYEGKLTNGTVFDSSYKRGQPASFPLNGVIKGWTEGLQLMKEGGKYEFVLPYDLAYGEHGAGAGIPPYATLIFTVELISVDS